MRQLGSKSFSIETNSSQSGKQTLNFRIKHLIFGKHVNFPPSKKNEGSKRSAGWSAAVEVAAVGNAEGAISFENDIS